MSTLPISTRRFIGTVASLILLPLAACTATDVQSNTETAAKAVKTDVLNAVDATPTADITKAVSGTYTGDPSHTYVGLTYLHQGYARATLRVDNTQIKMTLDSAAPEDSTLMVTMKTTDISSGTAKFDEHLMSPDFFDAAAHPEMTFKSTSMNMKTVSTGTVTGDLTIKGISKPVTLDVTLNKIGQHFRSKADMLGVSAKGQINRSDWDLGKYAPAVGDIVTLTIEAEMAIMPK